MYVINSYRVILTNEQISEVHIQSDNPISEAALNSVADILATDYEGTVISISVAESEEITVT